MLDFDVFRLDDNPLDSQGVQYPSLFGFEGDLSIGIHPLPAGSLELRIADSDGTATETYPGLSAVAYAQAIQRARLIADTYRAEWFPQGEVSV